MGTRPSRRSIKRGPGEMITIKISNKQADRLLEVLESASCTDIEMDRVYDLLRYEIQTSKKKKGTK